MDTPPTEDPYPAVRLGLIAVLLDGDAGTAFHQVLDLLDQGTPFEEVLYDVLAPIQADVGHRWQDGDYGIGDEHAVSAGVETLVAMLAGSFDQPTDGDTVVVATAEGDNHSLPAKILSAHLMYHGLRVINLGSSLPADALGAFLADHQPTALVLTCAMTSHLPGARRMIAEAHEAGVPVVAGGRGFGRDPLWAIALGADVWVDDPRRLPEELESLVPDVEAAEEAVMVRDAPGLADRWADLGALAESLANGAGGPAATIPEDVEVFARTFDAALLVDDPVPIVELVEWHRRLSRSTPDRVPTTDALLGAFVGRFGDLDDRIASFAETAGRS